MSIACSICLDDTCIKEFYVTDCNHIFHKECLLHIKNSKTSYMITKNEFTILNCPMCRKELSLYNLSYKTFNSEILDKLVFKYIKKINKIIKTLHLNRHYVFISGGFATALYSYLTNKKTHFLFNDIDIYYIDYDNLYEINDQKQYVNNCKMRNINIKDVQNVKGTEINHKQQKKKSYPPPSPLIIDSEADNHLEEPTNDRNTNTLPLSESFQNYDIVYLRNCLSDMYNYNQHLTHNMLEENILHTFNNFDLSCCKVAFTIYDDYIKFYVHSDYYRKNVNICYYSNKKTKERINKYKERGYEFNAYTYCCNFEF